MRIAIVNDVHLSVEILRRVVIAGGHEIAWVAHNGEDAVQQCLADRPDLVLMDLIMPVMDGVQATAEIMRCAPCAILIVTGSVSSHAAKVFEAMGCGALDAVGTPELRTGPGLSGGQALLDKIATIAKLIGAELPILRPAKGIRTGRSFGLPAMVALASSTGGPKALAAILSALPRHPGLAIAIVQHLDMQFSEGLAEWLNQHSQYRVVPVRQGMHLEPGSAFLAATNDHLILESDLTLRYTREPAENPYRPSVDVFFGSLRAHWPKPGVAVLLTGMGQDGAAGLLSLRHAGWHTIAQDKHTSVIFGMPAAAVRMGAAAEILPLSQIAHGILRRLEGERTTHAAR